jgi:hypothetical protein
MASTKTKAVKTPAVKKTGRTEVKRKVLAQKQTEAMAAPVIEHLANQPKLRNSSLSGAHVPLKKVARSGSVSGAAKPAVVNDPAVLATVCSAPRKAPTKKVAAKKSVSAKSHKSASPSATPTPSNSQPSSTSSAPVPNERRVNHDSPIGDKDTLSMILNHIAEGNKIIPVADNASFLDSVVTVVKALLGGRTFGASTYERLIRAALSAEQIKARKPLFTGLPAAIERLKLLASENTVEPSIKTAPDGGKPEAIADAITRAAAALNGTDNISRAHISRVLRRQVEGSSVNVVTQVNGEHLAHVMTDAFTRAEETLKEFPAAQRSSLRSFVTFFERFWGVIENRIELEHDFNDATFKNFLDSYADQHLTHGEYARFSFSCGARAIVHHTFAGSAMMTIAPNEFVAQLKRMPFADKQAVAEQALRNPPVFTFVSSVPQGLSAFVRCDVDMPGLSLLVLNRTFGDPIDYALHLGETCLATNIEHMLDYLVEKEASVLRRAA